MILKKKFWLLKNREFIKSDDKTESTLLDKEGNNVMIGAPINGSKMTAHGQAYLNDVSSTKSVAVNETSLNNEKTPLEIIMPPQPNPKICLIETGINNHVYPGRFRGEYFETTGYLTGAKGSHYLHDKKYDDYQKEQEDPTYETNPENIKKQNVAEFNNIMRIPKENVTTLKYGTKYFAQRLKQLQDEFIVEYDKGGITKQKSPDMCIAHDYIVKNIIRK